MKSYITHTYTVLYLSELGLTYKYLTYNMKKYQYELFPENADVLSQAEIIGIVVGFLVGLALIIGFAAALLQFTKKTTKSQGMWFI